MECQKSFANRKTVCFSGTSVNPEGPQAREGWCWELLHWEERTAAHEDAEHVQQPFLQSQAPDKSMPCFLPWFLTVAPWVSSSYHTTFQKRKRKLRDVQWHSENIPVVEASLAPCAVQWVITHLLNCWPRTCWAGVNTLHMQEMIGKFERFLSWKDGMRTVQNSDMKYRSNVAWVPAT